MHKLVRDGPPGAQARDGSGVYSFFTGIDHAPRQPLQDVAMINVSFLSPQRLSLLDGQEAASAQIAAEVVARLAEQGKATPARAAQATTGQGDVGQDVGCPDAQTLEWSRANEVLFDPARD